MKLAFAIGTSIGLVGVPASVGATEIGAPTREPVNDTRQTYDSSSPRFIGSTAKIVYEYKGVKKLCSGNLVSTDLKTPSFIMTGSGHCAVELTLPNRKLAPHYVQFPDSSKKFTIEKILVIETSNADFSILKLTEKPDFRKVMPLILLPSDMDFDFVKSEFSISYNTAGYTSRAELRVSSNCIERSDARSLRTTTCEGSAGNSGGAAIASLNLEELGLEEFKGEQYFLAGVIKGSSVGNSRRELKITPVSYFVETLEKYLNKFNK